MPVYYFNPQYAAFKDRNLWSLSNAFTSAFKKLAPIKQFEVTAKLGTFLNQTEEGLLKHQPLQLVSNANNITPIKPDEIDDEDIPEDPYTDEIFDTYFDEELADEAIDEATERLVAEYERQVA